MRCLSESSLTPFWGWRSRQLLWEGVDCFMAKSELTPLMKQYWEMKSPHPDKILLFRMGDFFEMFYEDAQKAAPVLGITLTSRNKKSGDHTPMCGVPHHSIGGQINKLLAHGYKVAICDQVEDAKQAKGLVKRAITRILSPGMVYDPDTIDGDQWNCMAAFDQATVSFVETTTGECFFYEVSDPAQQKNLLKTLQPVELIVSEAQEKALPESLKSLCLISTHEGLSEAAGAVAESGSRLISYGEQMQGGDWLQGLRSFEKRDYIQRLQISSEGLRHLEVFQTYKGDRAGSLFETINKTVTAGGSRLLRHWLCFPLRSQSALEKRFDAIDEWRNSYDKLQEVRRHLRQVGDLERKLGKVSQPNAHPRDLQVLSSVFEAIEAILRGFPEKKTDLELIARWKNRLAATLEQDIPLNYKDGGVICRGVSHDLDELIDLATNSQKKVSELEASEKEKTGISSLKVRYNNVFGYYIEVTKVHSSKVPANRYLRKQTLTNAERYTTDELNELESKVLSARTRRFDLEVSLYRELRKEFLQDVGGFLLLAEFLKELDVIGSLAWLSLENNYCRPKWAEAGLSLKASRHPTVELQTDFVSNDIVLSSGESILLTGPNMAGKSTIMRQVVLTALMAQVGSFVPASQAELPLFDHVFTRIGASDFLSEGLSTFMVEMKETAEMLEQSTNKSLVILDEVGRGTSTYDGLSLAQAILEHLVLEKAPYVFFATHYHELTALESVHENVTNAHMSIQDHKTHLQFLYTLRKGPAEKSYGIQVAKLAGLPTQVVRRAAHLLSDLESQSASLQGSAPAPQLDLWSLNLSSESEDGPVVLDPVWPDKIKDVALPKTTPLEALNILAKWQEEVAEMEPKSPQI